MCKISSPKHFGIEDHVPGSCMDAVSSVDKGDYSNKHCLLGITIVLPVTSYKILMTHQSTVQHR